MRVIETLGQYTIAFGQIRSAFIGIGQELNTVSAETGFAEGGITGEKNGNFKCNE
jgi:hypothetical protein